MTLVADGLAIAALRQRSGRQEVGASDDRLPMEATATPA